MLYLLNLTTSNYFGIVCIIVSIIIYLLKGTVLDLQEKRGSRLFRKENRNIHDIRAWIGILFFFLYGLWLLIK